MLAKTESVALIGTEARLVEVEVDVADTGVPAFRIVGLPAKSVTEAEQRVRAALEAAGRKWPLRRMTANLAPGGLRKAGAHFDLAIAVGVIAASGAVDRSSTSGWLMMGELALDGSVRPVRGTLAGAIACKALGRKGIVCPLANGAEAAAVEGLEVVAVETLSDVLRFFEGRWSPPQIRPVAPAPSAFEDMSDVKGHADAKKALEVAAAGGHNLLMCGPPGSGKTMLARRLPGILPSLTREEAIDVTRVYSIAGLLDEHASLIDRRPFRSPHHHVSIAGMIGGGSGIAHPGEVSLANHGVLFLDEMPSFKSSVLESLRGPLEDGIVRIARSGGVVAYPARFSLIAAMNPCPCGKRDAKDGRCRCTHLQLHGYRSKLSGPLMDRFDIQMLVNRPSRQELMSRTAKASSIDSRARVEMARELQAARHGPGITNASCKTSGLLENARLDTAALALLSGALDHGSLTGRGFARVLRVSRTIADLDGVDRVLDEHVSEALSYRIAVTEEAAA